VRAQDGYCATSVSFGNASTGVFAQPSEVFNLQQLFQARGAQPA
jgi:hypothetical protein